MIWHLAATPCDTTSIDTTKEDYLARLQHCAWHLALISHTNYHQLDTISGIHWYWYPIGLEQNENSTYIALFYTTLLSPTPFKTPLSQLRWRLCLFWPRAATTKNEDHPHLSLSSHMKQFSHCFADFVTHFFLRLWFYCVNWILKMRGEIDIARCFRRFLWHINHLCNFGVFLWQHFRSVAALQLEPLSRVQTW